MQCNYSRIQCQFGCLYREGPQQAIPIISALWPPTIENRPPLAILWTEFDNKLPGRSKTSVSLVYVVEVY